MFLSTVHRFIKKYWKSIFLLVFVAGLSYLPNISKLTLYKDDWYYFVDGFFGGSRIFHQMFFIDRPYRGYLFEYLFRILGTNPLHYQLLSFFWRVLSGITYYWLLNLVWPKNEKLNIWISIFFLLYPGYLWWVSAIEYQPMILSQLLQGFSFVMTILCLRKKGFIIKPVLFSFSVISGLISLLLVDYTIGMELFRVVLIYFSILHEDPIKKTATRIKETIIHGLPFLIIPSSFMFWRLFFFENFRTETDISIQLAKFLSAPLQIGGDWIVNLVKSIFNLNILGWIQPFSNNFFSIELANMFIAVVLATIGILVVNSLLRNDEKFCEELTDKNQVINWKKEMLIGGIIGMIGGIIPIIMMNREIAIKAYSHYLLNILFASAPFLIIVIQWFKTEKIRKLFLLGMLAFCIIANYSYSVNIKKEEKSIADFWTQVTIRAPAFEKGTTFLINLPNSSGLDNFDAIWAPINLLYMDPANINITDGIINYPYAGLSPESETTKKVIINDETEIGYRSHVSFPKLDQLVVISQPTTNSCVHVIDSKWPRLSITDPDQVLLTSPRSDISNILPERTYINIDERVFGEMPKNNWCVIYQKAELALQFEKWDEIELLRVEAEYNGFKPKDQIEWMPFLQAAIYFGDSNQISSIMSEISQPFIAVQACDAFLQMYNDGIIKNLANWEYEKTMICGKK